MPLACDCLPGAPFQNEDPRSSPFREERVNRCLMYLEGRAGYNRRYRTKALNVFTKFKEVVVCDSEADPSRNGWVVRGDICKV